MFSSRLYTGQALADTPGGLTWWERIAIAALVVAYLTLIKG